MAYEFSVLISTFGVERSTLKKYIVASILSADRQASIKTGERILVHTLYFACLPQAGTWYIVLFPSTFFDLRLTLKKYLAIS